MTDAYVGEIRIWPGKRCPNDWHFCDGTALPINQYQVLYTLLGTTYGGNGQTDFKLPDLRNRVPIHQGQGAGLTLRPIASTGGVDSVTLTIAEIPNHTHTLTASSVFANTVSTPPLGGSFASADPASGLAFYSTVGHGETLNIIGPQTLQNNPGVNAAHSNIMPNQTMNFIICLNGIFPSQN